MLIHAKTIHSSISGNRVIDTECEKCAHRFSYEMWRTAKGAASSLYGMFPVQTAARAQGYAVQKLAKALASNLDLVPCPKCDWVNDSTIVNFRKQKYCNIKLFAIGAAVLGSLILLLAFSMKLMPPNSTLMGEFRASPRGVYEFCIPMGIIILSVAILATILFQFLRLLINPNYRLMHKK